MRRTCLVVVASLTLACPGVMVVPDQARAYNVACAEHLSRGELVEAEVLCDHSLEYQPAYADALTNKGIIRQTVGDVATAKALFIKALRSNPDQLQAANDLGVLALEAREFEAARSYFRLALRVDPDFAQARHNLGLASLRMGDLDGAENAFRHLVAATPAIAQGHASLGGVLLIRARYALAAASFERAVGLEAGYADAWLGLGTAREALGELDGAREAYEACVDASGPAACGEGLARLPRTP
jgi:tetratricopeptide (TPR) repeat protein